ncbi:uncharacterized protein C8Q71DRAFT_729183 [Rhodofomes roseus]|uniref:N-acetyltransferase domain-containing protein n=1 Tax=Rhodofomes roseus TaxID=34475 RepID=A0ABQ8KWC1_9APHY|nr:uncharacterized protein C8Q71DRAFT_729183 [Rhodofomes roseus]KAH9843599.1 hypothetical protein C8Q71DRAFT_729183 [Rhodofomes roseus]
MRQSMSSVTVRRVYDVTDAQLEELASLFILNMNDDLAAISICGGDRSLMGTMARAMIRAATLDGEIYTAAEQSDRILGYAVWMPPGQDLLSTPEQRKLGWDDFFEHVSQRGKDWFTKTYATEVSAFMAGIFGPTGKVDSWYLNIIMVHPDYHRRGIATKLVDVVRSKAAANGDTMALSTSSTRNVPIYKALHFDLVGEKMIPSPWGDWPLYVFIQKIAGTE